MGESRHTHLNVEQTWPQGNNARQARGVQNQDIKLMGGGEWAGGGREVQQGVLEGILGAE